MPLLPTSLLGFSMDFMSMILWCGMRSLDIINDAQNFFMVNSHLDHTKLLKALIGIKLLDENWQDKFEATLRNTTVTVLGSSSWSKECAVDRQKSVVVKSSCFGGSSNLQSLLHHADKITEDIFPKLAIDFELSSPKIHAELVSLFKEGFVDCHMDLDTTSFRLENSFKRKFCFRNHGTWRVTPDNMCMIFTIVVCVCQSSEIPIRLRKRDYSDVHFLEWIHLDDKDAVNFKYILVVPSTVPHVLENY
ncbi:hypothetical protein FF1_044093 [Malus domestica]